MKRAPFLLALSTLLLGSSLAYTPKAVLNARASAVQIMMAVGQGQRPICTGSVVSLPQGPRIVTAGHCALSKGVVGATLTALDYQGHIWPMRLESAEFNWPKRDYAVYNSAAQFLLPALKVAAKPFVIGDDCFSWSGPAGLNVMLFHGEISGELHFPGNDFAEERVGGMTYSSNLLVAGGASGSAVLNENGEAVAILVGGFSTSNKLAGAFFAPLPPAMN